jgi:hypothetical protein
MRISLTLCLLLAAVGAAPFSQVSQLTFSAGAVADVGEAHVNFLGVAGPASFFKNLRRTETPSGVRYETGSEEVRFFPSHLLINVTAIQDNVLAKKRVDRGFMNELHFDGHWKRGMYLRPVKNLSIASPAPQHSSSAWSEGWMYYLNLDDPDVPLDDHLIIDVLAGDNKRVARMSFSLNETKFK